MRSNANNEWVYNFHPYVTYANEMIARRRIHFEFEVDETKKIMFAEALNILQIEIDDGKKKRINNNGLCLLFILLVI